MDKTRAYDASGRNKSPLTVGEIVAYLLQLAKEKEFDAPIFLTSAQGGDCVKFEELSSARRLINDPVYAKQNQDALVKIRDPDNMSIWEARKRKAGRAYPHAINYVIVIDPYTLASIPSTSSKEHVLMTLQHEMGHYLTLPKISENRFFMHLVKYHYGVKHIPIVGVSGNEEKATIQMVYAKSDLEELANSVYKVDALKIAMDVTQSAPHPNWSTQPRHKFNHEYKFDSKLLDAMTRHNHNVPTDIDKIRLAEFLVDIAKQYNPIDLPDRQKELDILKKQQTP